MHFLTSENDLLFEKGLFALYFYADWMPFHKKMVSSIEKIESKYPFNFYAIDISSFDRMPKRFNLESLPTIIVYNNGKEVKRIVGIVLMSAFRSTFADIYNASTLGMEKKHGKEKD